MVDARSKHAESPAWTAAVIAMWLNAIFLGPADYAATLAGFHVAVVTVSAICCIAGDDRLPVYQQRIILLVSAMFDDPVVTSGAFALVAASGQA